MRTGILWIVVVFVMTLGTAQAMDANDVRAGYLERLRLLRNLMVEYDVKHAMTEESTARIMSVFREHGLADDDELSPALVVGNARAERFSCLDGMTRFESGAQLMTATPLHNGRVEHEATDVQSEVTIVAGGVVEYLTILPWAGPGGRITSGPNSDSDAIDKPWGLRYLGTSLDDRLPEWCHVQVIGDGKGELRFVYGSAFSDRWVVDADKDYAPVIQERIAEDGHVIFRTQMSEWNEVGGTWVAYKVKKDLLSSDPNGVEHIGSTETYTVKSCKVGSKKNTPALYKMAWPDGTLVDDARDGKKYAAKNGRLEPVQ